MHIDSNDLDTMHHLADTYASTPSEEMRDLERSREDLEYQFSARVSDTEETYRAAARGHHIEADAAHVDELVTGNSPIIAQLLCDLFKTDPSDDERRQYHPLALAMQSAANRLGSELTRKTTYFGKVRESYLQKRRLVEDCAAAAAGQAPGSMLSQRYQQRLGAATAVRMKAEEAKQQCRLLEQAHVLFVAAYEEISGEVFLPYDGGAQAALGDLSDEAKAKAKELVDAALPDDI